MRRDKPYSTYFTSVENDRAIYFAAVAQIPGLHTPEALAKPIKQERLHSFAEAAMKTRYAALFFANVDDLMARPIWDTGWDAVWLDYTGPLTIERMAVIERFYQNYVREILIITALKARWNEKTVKAMEKAGGHSQWIAKHIDGDVLHDIEYTDTSPMAQIAFRKRHEWKNALT
jgi:hypothetical protein